MMRRVFVIADVHGHYDRLVDLLAKAGIADNQGNRINRDVEVIQLGDLGHHGDDGNAGGDLFCFRAAVDGLIDIVLWGNHDYAVVSNRHAFHSFRTPREEVRNMMSVLVDQGRLRFAAARHGWLITHAGLGRNVMSEKLMQKHGGDPEKIAEDLNFLGELSMGGQFQPLIDAIDPVRGGDEPFGGILWRHWRNDSSVVKLAAVKQICGHTRGDDVRVDADGNVCIDIGDKNNGRLAGVWLPDGKGVIIDRPDWS